MKENNPQLGKENKSDDRKFLFKSPLPRPKFSTDQSVARLRRFSLEGSGHEKNQQKTKHLELDQYLQITTEQFKYVAHEEIKANKDIENFSQDNELERLPTCSPGISSSSVSQSTTPDIKKINSRSSSTFSSSKGSQHIRKSLQTIGKLINGSEKRNFQVSSLMPPSKLNTDLHAMKKSPATAESRYNRRQSLTNVQFPEIKGSRRSSLGGKSVESYTPTGIVVPMTPSAVPASTKSTKSWF